MQLSLKTVVVPPLCITYAILCVKERILLINAIPIVMSHDRVKFTWSHNLMLLASFLLNSTVLGKQNYLNILIFVKQNDIFFHSNLKMSNNWIKNTYEQA